MLFEDTLKFLHHCDKDVTLWLNSLHCPVSDFLWQCITEQRVWYVLYLVIAVFLFVRLGWKKALIVIVACILTVTACDQLANFTKDFFGRLRPCHDLDMVGRGLNILEKKGGLYGFYSAHAATCAGFAKCSTMGFRLDRTHRYNGYMYWISAWAFLVAISRVFVGKHFIGDVLVGILIGWFIGWIIGWLATRLIKDLRLRGLV